jgi:hypothetical protein
LHPGVVPVKQRTKLSLAMSYIRHAVLGDGGRQDENGNDDNASVLFTVTAWKHGPRSHYDDDGEEVVSDSKLPAVVTTTNDPAQKQLNTPVKSPGQRFARFYATNKISFLLCVAIAVALAYPKLGAVYLRPDITTAWIVVPFVLRKYIAQKTIYRHPLLCVCVYACLFESNTGLVRCKDITGRLNPTIPFLFISMFGLCLVAMSVVECNVPNGFPILQSWQELD